MRLIYIFVALILNGNNGYNADIDAPTAINGRYMAAPLQAIALEVFGPSLEEEAEDPRAIDPSRPIIAFTFDDGPNDYYTERILDILEYHNVRATFCVLGKLIEDNRSTLIRMYELGHEIIGHSWSHPNFSRISADEIASQILRTTNVIDEVTGSNSPLLFRPPFGMVTDTVKQVAKEHGYAMINWSIDPRDWYFRDPNYIYAVIRDNLSNGSIILLHDTLPTTIEAVALTLPRLLDDGYQFVTVSELLLHINGEITPGTLYRGF